MIRKRILKSILFLLIPVTSQGIEQTIIFTAEPIVTNFYLIRAAGQPLHDNVLAFTGNDGILLVDSGYLETASLLKKTLSRMSKLPVKYLINTHYHHAGANEAFADSLIVAHKNVRSRMQKKTLMYGTIPIGPWNDAGLPKQTFETETTIYFNGETIRLLHFPNVHTDGDTVVFFEKAEVIATGDFFVPLLGPCDHANGCNWNDYVHGAKRLLELSKPNSLIAPGHGPLSTYKDLKEFSSMLSDATAFVQKQIEEGKDVNRIKASGLPQQWQKWSERGISSDFFISNVYSGLTGGTANQ
ncbi:MBL fold metallo-hydrolase [bacterium]|nr:MBL fold metallo-hydrolase [bacterium]